MAVDVNEPNNLQLREALQEITDQHDEWPDILEHIACIRELAAQYPHSIILEREATQEDYHYTCFSYAFDLLGSVQVRDRRLWRRNVFPDSKFAEWFISRSLTEIAPSQA